MTIKRALRACLPAIVAAALLWAPASAQAGFGLVPGSLSAVARNADGTLALQAGAHPYSYEVDFELKAGPGGETEGGEARSFVIDLPPGLVGNPQAVPQCTRQQFDGAVPHCPPETQVGVLRPTTDLGLLGGPIYNMTPPPGVAAQLGFSLSNHNALQNASVRSEEGYGVRIDADSLPIEVRSVNAQIWGVPADPGHDAERGLTCLEIPEACAPSSAPTQAFLTMPTSCESPPTITVRADSKLAPGAYDELSAQQLDAGGNPAAMAGCEAVPFHPQVAAQPTTRLAENPSGLDFELTLPNQGWLSPGAIAETEPERAEVTLPEGVTVNPSAAQGFATCSEAQYRAEGPNTAPGEGCPEASKLGSIIGHSPLLDEAIEGSLYLAEPYENPTHSLIGLYLIARAGERGVVVKQAGEVQPDPTSGRLVTTFDHLPPLPYSDFRLHFREGGRAPLVSPPGCGAYATTAKLSPFSDPGHPYTVISSFTIDHGVDGGACPAGAAPFRPEFAAGTENNQAAAFSPFFMRLTRNDGDQDLTKFSAKLPPGVVGRLAGTAECPDSAIARARSRTGEHGGEEEKSSPSCPADSQIGHVVAGAGVGSLLTYVPGRLYLAGPYKGAPLSVVAIVPALAGPFDAGTVVTREALRIDPLTAEVEADGSSSDPIPHILKGILLRVRDIRVYVDKPDFTLNPTSCEESATEATIWSGGQNVFSTLDDVAHSLDSRFQAASCASLPFKPRLGLTLRGSTPRRGGHPALRGVYSPRKGDANLKKLVLRLPHSAFLDQAHIRTICTRVQFAAGGGNGGGCPKGAVYGHATAWTPLLSEPLSGPVYLRSSNHNLPDFVAALRGLVDVEAVARIDSVHGGLRATFASVPDAPLSRVIVNMQGGKTGLIVNSRNLCFKPKRNRANARFDAHNGRRSAIKPLVRAAKCGKAQRRHGRHRKRGG